MAEENNAGEAAAQASGADGGDRVAMALGLAGASRDRADSFLQKQEALIEDQRRVLHLQTEEMRERNPYERSHLRLRRFSGWARAALEFSIGVIALAVAVGLGGMVWNAAHGEGVIVESFAVPPQMVEQGLSGEAVASQMLDRLDFIATNTRSVNFAPNLSGGRDTDIKVEIPDTGISLGEIYRFLRRWLGNETRVNGEVWRTADGIVVAARINGVYAARYAGKEAELEALLQKAAEHVVEIIDPPRFSTYLTRTPARLREAQAILERTVADPLANREIKARAWNNLGVLQERSFDAAKGLATIRRAFALYPDRPIVAANLIGAEKRRDHAEAVLALVPVTIRLLESPPANYRPDFIAGSLALQRMTQAELLGDYGEAARHARAGSVVNIASNQDSDRRNVALNLAMQHDGAGVRAWLRDMPAPANADDAAGLAVTRLAIAAALQDWRTVVATGPDAEKAANRENLRLLSLPLLRPLQALAKARLGDITGAEAQIAQSPADCYRCVRIRGMIASEARQWPQADFWFARAVADAPSIPMAHEDWGRSLLARGQDDAAIAQFSLANQKGPKFADALEGWGEALMAKNQSHLALAKFTEAEKYAPDWGRLHLKWGEALAYAGKPEEAKAKFARATTLDLTPNEKSELARQK